METPELENRMVENMRKKGFLRRAALTAGIAALVAGGMLIPKADAFAAEDTATVTDAVPDSVSEDKDDTPYVSETDEGKNSEEKNSDAVPEKDNDQDLNEGSDTVLDEPDDKGVTVLNGVDYSAVYDWHYYTSKYPDIKKVYGDDQTRALWHFVNFGMKEKRQGCASFDVNSYIKAYPDLRSAYRNNYERYYEHYIRYGYSENRVSQGIEEMINPVYTYKGTDYSKVYSYKEYIKYNAAVTDKLGVDNDYGLIEDFVQNGMKAKRRGNENFDVQSYIYQYPDLRNAYRNNYEKFYEHYMKFGFDEGRISSGVTELQNPVTFYNNFEYKTVYDPAYYAAMNKDIRKVIGADNDYGLIEHFVKNGINEKRPSSENFNLRSYINANIDLRKAYGSNWRAYLEHYVKYGRKEGRTAVGVPEIVNPRVKYKGVDYSKVYDFKFYIAHNPELKYLYDCNDIGAIQHFVEQGIPARKQAKETFDVRSYINAHKDLRQAFGGDIAAYVKHYMEYGQKEGRMATGMPRMLNFATDHILGDYAGIYDFNDYTDKYSDMIRTYGFDDVAILNHFVRFGIKEGRTAKASYDSALYNEKQKLSKDLYKEQYRNGWLKYSNRWFKYDNYGTIIRAQKDAPTLVTLSGYYVSPMKTGNLNSREERIEAMIERAYEYMGTTYQICKSTQPGNAVDCSGLVMQCLYAAGFDPYPATPAHHALPENEYDSRTLYNQTPMQHVSYSNIKRGDLIYYKSGRGNIIIHVAIYLGNGRVIEAWPPAVTDSYGVASWPHPYIYGVTRPFP